MTGGFWFNMAAHELGHAFGLLHDFRSHEYIMSYGDPLEPRLSDCHAEFLVVHPYLNPAVPVEEVPPPAIQLLSATEYPAGSQSVSVRFRLSDAEGLHQILLLGEERGGGYYEVWSCRNLAGKEDEDVEFEYDGYGSSYAEWGNIRRLSDGDVFRLESLVVDRAGNAGSELLELWQEEEEEGRRASTIAIIAGDRQEATPGTALANPLVVEVRDQHDQPLPAETIQFGVTEGEAKLSGRYLIENVTTDANGRAELSLSLGPSAETAIVRVSVPRVPECQPVIFTAIGVGASAVPVMHGDAHTWHLPDGVIARLGGGRMPESDRAVSFSPDGQHFAVASGIGVWLYDVATSRPLALWPTSGPVRSVTFSRDGTLLAAAAGPFGNETVSLWAVATGLRTFTRTAPFAQSVAFSPDQTLLASGSMDRLVRLWDLATGQNVATWGEWQTEGLLLPGPVAFSPDGALLAGGFRDGTVRMWDVATREPIATLPGHRDGVRSVAFSRDGKTLASGSKDGDIRLWDVKTRRNAVTLKGHSSHVMSVVFLPDERTLASGSWDGTVKLWDVATGKPVTSLTGGDASEITSISSSPDGRILASGSFWTGTIVLWDPRTGNGGTLDGPGHSHLGESVAFSPDGKTLASGSEDGTAALWDASTLAHLGTLWERAEGRVRVSFSSDGTMLAVAGPWQIQL